MANRTEARAPSTTPFPRPVPRRASVRKPAPADRFFRHLVSDDGSVRHTGDNLVGGVGQGGDDEAILVDLARIPVHIDQIVFTVNSFTGQTFQEVQNAFCRLVDETNGQELARYTLAGGGSYTAQIMAKVHRTGPGWTMTALGTPANGRTFQDLMPAILPHL